MEGSHLVPSPPDCTRPMDGRRRHLHATACSHNNEHLLKPFELAGYDAFRKSGQPRPHKEHSRLKSIGSKQGPNTLESWWCSDDDARETRLRIVSPLLTDMSSSAGAAGEAQASARVSATQGKLAEMAASTFDPLSLSRRERIKWLESLDAEAEKPSASPTGDMTRYDNAGMSKLSAAVEAPKTPGRSRLLGGARPGSVTLKLGRWQAQPRPNTSNCLTELADAVGGQSVDVELLRRCSRTLGTWSYELPLSEALRAMALLNEGAMKAEASKLGISKINPLESHKCNLFGESVADEMRAAVYAIGATISATIVACDLSATVEALVQMAQTCTARQELLDSTLAHLMTLFRQKPRDFKPHVMARIMGALGRMRAEGGFEGSSLCPSAGTSAASAAANQRFLTVFNARVYQMQLDFIEDDVGTVHEAYAGNYLTEEQLHKFLWRAAQLQVGLLPHSAKYLSVLQGIQRAALATYPSLMEAGLKPLVHLYCKRLVAADTAEGPRLDHSSWRYHGNVGSIGPDVTTRLKRWGCGVEPPICVFNRDF